MKFDGAATGSTSSAAVWDDAVKLLPARQGRLRHRREGEPARAAPGPAGFYAGVGTILFNMVVNPVSGKVYVSNTEARNEQRFEGPAPSPATAVRGHLHESRITVLEPDGGGDAAAPEQAHRLRHLLRAGPQRREREEPRAPAGHGRSRRRRDALRRGARLEQDRRLRHRRARDTTRSCRSTREPDRGHGGGPTGLVLDETAPAALRADPLRQRDRDRRHDHAHGDRRTSPMHNPEPASVVAGRRFLYDAALTSSHGDSACASCHVFGDFDSLAWDLGNPDGATITNPGPFARPNPAVLVAARQIFHPMKGPMTTQSLRGMANHGPMHWRGDRTGGNDAPTAQPDSGTFDEDAAFKKFQAAFADLLGRSEPALRRGHAGVHRLHPPGHLSAEPDPQPRQLAHARSAGRPRLSSSARSPTRTEPLRGLPRARPRRQPTQPGSRLLRHDGL